MRNNVYNFNISYEKATYKKIGLDYAPKGIFKINAFCRRCRNSDGKLYQVCNTYSDWEKHVKSILPLDIMNYQDFIHWLIEQKRNAEISLEMTKIILIPIYIGILTVVNSLYEALIYVFVIIVFSVVILYNGKQSVDFWDDVFKVANDVVN